MSRWPTHLSFRARELREIGVPYKLIAREVGRTPQAVKRHLQRLAA